MESGRDSPGHDADMMMQAHSELQEIQADFRKSSAGNDLISFDQSLETAEIKALIEDHDISRDFLLEKWNETIEALGSNLSLLDFDVTHPTPPPLVA